MIEPFPVTISVACHDGTTMHVDIEDRRPGGLVPGEETASTDLVLRTFDSAGRNIALASVPIQAVRAAFARRRFAL